MRDETRLQGRIPVLAPHRHAGDSEHGLPVQPTHLERRIRFVRTNLLAHGVHDATELGSRQDHWQIPSLLGPNGLELTGLFA